ARQRTGMQVSGATGAPKWRTGYTPLSIGHRCWRRLFRLLVGVDQVTRFQVIRCEYALIGHAAKDIEAVALLDAVILHLQHAALSPFTVIAKLDVAVNGLKGGLLDVFGKLVIVERVGTSDRIAEHLDVGVTPTAEVVAERIDAFRLGALLVFL